MRLGRPLLFAACALALMSGVAAAGTRAGVAGAVDPGVTVTAPDGKSHPLKVGDDIATDDKIVTDGGGRAEILFLDQSSIGVGPNSELLIDEFSYKPADGTGNLTTEVGSGALRFVGGALSKHDDAVKIITPATLLGVRGGIALIEVTAGGGTRATFLYGDMLTIDAVDGTVTRIARPGFFSIVAGKGAAPSAPARANAAELAATLASLRTRSPYAEGGSSGHGNSARALQALESDAALALLLQETEPFNLIQVLGYSSQTRPLPANPQQALTLPVATFNNQPPAAGGVGEPGIGIPVGR